MNAARTNWLARSAMKLRTSRGPYVEEVVARTEIVMENEVPATVNIDVPIVVRIDRPPLALRASRNPIRVPSFTRAWSTATRSSAMTMAAIAEEGGKEPERLSNTEGEGVHDPSSPAQSCAGRWLSGPVSGSRV